MPTASGRRRLLIVADSLAGGTGAVALAQVAWFESRGWTVRLAAPPPVPEGAGPLDYEPIDIPPTARRMVAMSRAAAAVRRCVRAAAPQVVHCHGLRSLAVTWPLNGRPFVTLHGAGPVPSDPVGYDLLRRCGLATAATVARGAFTAAPEFGGRWRFVPHASPRLASLAKKPFPPADDTPTVLWLGRLDEGKQPDLFVRAVARAAEWTPIRGVMAGTGPRSAEVRELVEELGAPVGLLGHVDPEPLLASAWAVALFSRHEALAFAVQEAMWSARSVVTSPLPGLRWLVGDGGVHAADVDAAAEALVRLTDHHEAAARGALAAARIRRLIDPSAPWPTVEAAYGAASTGRAQGAG